MRDLLPHLLTLAFGGVSGYLLKFWLDRRAERERLRHGEKQPHYRNLLLCLKSLSEGRRANDQLLMFEFYFLWLYAPDDVVRAAGRLVQAHAAGATATEETRRSLLADLLVAIRRDMGFSDTALSGSDLVRWAGDHAARG
jgi:hypothetical protein